MEIQRWIGLDVHFEENDYLNDYFVWAGGYEEGNPGIGQWPDLLRAWRNTAWILSWFFTQQKCEVDDVFIDKPVRMNINGEFRISAWLEVTLVVGEIRWSKW